MPSGPQHYLEAERLIGLVEAGESSDTMLAADELLMAAQVHATLALAAATALANTGEMFVPDCEAWERAASVDAAASLAAMESGEVTP